MTLLVVGLALFIGTHGVSIFADEWRETVIARIGRNLWRAGYSVVSLLGLSLIFVGYGLARETPIIVYQPPFVLRYLALALLLPVFPLLLATYLMGAMTAITKHPTLVAVKLWAAAHLMVNGSLQDVVLFGSILAWAIADRVSLKRRATSTIPATRSWSINDWIAVIVGLAIYLLFIRGLHEWLTGMPIVLPW